MLLLVCPLTSVFRCGAGSSLSSYTLGTDMYLDDDQLLEVVHSRSSLVDVTASSY
jgi:hypothetical protein